MEAVKQTVLKRLDALRAEMKKADADYFLTTSSDYHTSEYVGGYFKVSEYFSGCTSDNVILIVSQTDAKLWTDGRYFISAAAELAGSGIELMKMGEPNVPAVPRYLETVLSEGKTLAFDGRCVTGSDGLIYRSIAAKCKAKINGAFAPQDTIWTDRPAIARHKIFLLPEKYSGESCQDKLARVRKYLQARKAGYLVLSRLDDIMWLLNIRGADILYNPVALSWLVLGPDFCTLFIQKEESSPELEDYASKNKIELRGYDAIFGWIRDYSFSHPVYIDPRNTNDAMLTLLKSKAAAPSDLVTGQNPTTVLKAVKNETELANMRAAYLDDSVALCEFIYYIKTNIGQTPLTELSAAAHLDHLRSEIPDFIDLSFETISAYNANAAMAHYAPDVTTCSTLQPEGFLLVDSGGQYLRGTTDVTRTIVLGKLTNEMIRDFTTVAVSNLRLLYAKFLQGCTGASLDIYARAPFWERGLNFNHGTGHGIGYLLNVHEGPQNIRWRNSPAVFEPGMITSDEPGIYWEGKYGIRTETITECVEDETNEFGRFLRFAPLTYAPIDLEAIDSSQMDASDIEKLNDYHRLVWEKISPFLSGEERAWLKEATRAI